MENFRPPQNRSCPGLTFFVTAHLRADLHCFAEPAHAQMVHETLQYFRRNGEMILYAYVIMPNHVHLIIKPLEPHTLPEIMRRFKSFTARQIATGGIWGESYWSETITEERHLILKTRYIHSNPVKAGLSETPEAYRWSSAPEYFGDGESTTIDSYGE